MNNLKKPQEYFGELVSQNRAKMTLADAFDAAKKTFEKEKGLLAPYKDHESFSRSMKR